MTSSTAWYASRAAGLVSYALLWASVIWGILISSRPFSTKVSRAGILDWHRLLSTAALVFAGLHASVLLVDKHVGYSAGDLLIPFSTEKSPLATAMGIVAFELGVAIAVSFKFRKQLGKGLWRGLHMLSYPVFFLALAHFVAMGTDAKGRIVFGIAIVSGLTVVVATAFRVMYRPGSPAARETVAVADAT